MYDSSPDLSSDLEWMLQSKQATPLMLAGAMVQEYGEQVFRLSLALLSDQEAARRASEETFVKVLLSIHRYSSSIGIRDFIFTHAIQICHNKAPRSIEIPVLYYLFGWKTDEIASLLMISQEIASEKINEMRRLFQESLDPEDQNSLDADQLDLRLTDIFQERWPSTNLSDEEITRQVSRILLARQRLEYRRRTKTTILEVGVVATIILGVVGLMRGMSILYPDVEPTANIIFRTVLVTRQVTPAIIVEPIIRDPAHPISTRDAPFNPVNLVSLMLMDRPLYVSQPTRAGLENWKTLWLDVEFVDYGPPGYIGPARFRRIQAWISPDRVIILRGHPALSPSSVDLVLMEEDAYLHAVPGGKQTRISNEDVDSLFSFPSYSENLAILFMPMSVGNLVTNSMSFEISDGEEIAGRPTVKITSVSREGNAPSETWVDRETHLILRQLIYTGENSRQLESAVQVNAVAYDMEFPDDLFDPNEEWQRGFVTNFHGIENQAVFPVRWPASSGTRVVPPFQTPPAGFDPAGSQLIFQYPQSYNAEAPREQVEVFADGFYLGKVMFGNPWTMICARSPDGRKIAYVSQPMQQPPGDGFINWFTLENQIGKLHNGLGGVYITQIAFSPDSKFLAVFGRYDSIKGVYVVDTETGVAERLLRLEDAKSLVWSPDGKYLAMIARTQEDPTQDRVTVVQIGRGKVVYEKSVDFETNAMGDWPTWLHEVNFPFEEGGFEACLAPP
jgi:hypothetical protein